MLLDEPLANLDYKLREGLRDELPRLFADRGCTVVYATTEPSEALLLGGHVATLHEGRVTQFGPSGSVYREPVDLTTARVFSDPPINTAAAVKRGERIQLSEHVGWPTGRSPAGAARRRLHHRAASAPRAPAPGRARGAGRLQGADHRDQRLGERDPLRPGRAHLGVAVPRRARLPGRRGRPLRARRRPVPLLRSGRPRASPPEQHGRASAWSDCGTATSPNRRARPTGRCKRRGPAMGRRRRLRAARPVRLRQDDAAQHRVWPAAARPRDASASATRT